MTVLLKHYWKQEYKAATVTQAICEIIQKRVGVAWLKLFKNADKIMTFTTSWKTNVMEY